MGFAAIIRLLIVLQLPLLAAGSDAPVSCAGGAWTVTYDPCRDAVAVRCGGDTLLRECRASFWVQGVEYGDFHRRNVTVDTTGGAVALVVESYTYKFVLCTRFAIQSDGVSVSMQAESLGDGRITVDDFLLKATLGGSDSPFRIVVQDTVAIYGNEDKNRPVEIDCTRRNASPAGEESVYSSTMRIETMRSP